MSKRAIFLGGKRAAGAVADAGIGVGTSPLVAEWSAQAPTVEFPSGSSPFEEVPSSDWRLSDFGPGSTMSFDDSPNGSNSMVGANAAGFFSYGMRWELDIEEDATISTATLVFRTTDSSLSNNEHAEVYIGSHQNANSGVPAGASAARSQTDRCGSQWSGASDLFSGSGAVQNTEYEVDVKTIIEGVIGRTGWASGNGMTLILCGPASDLGSGAGCETQATVSSLTRVFTLDASNKPELTVVFK
jgi:hypothetical protein